MIDIIHWTIYYIKCLFNIIISYFSNNNIVEATNIKAINTHLRIVRLNGNYFDMGFEYGRKMKNILKLDVKKYYHYITRNQSIHNKRIPIHLRKTDITKSLLNLYNINKTNFNINVIDFMKGVSKGSGINFEKLLCVNLFTDLMDNHCILMSKKIKGKILNLRTFDYGGPNMTHTLIVFHPTNTTSYCSLNISCIFGIVSGVSKNGMFFGETYHDNILGEISYNGMPFHHIAHKILGTCKNIDESYKIMQKINRTSNLELMIGDKDGSMIYLFNKDKLILKDSYYTVTPNERENFYKNEKYLDSIENVIKKFIPKTKSGELHCIVTYDGYLYVSVTTNFKQSYNNDFYKFKISQLFK